MTKTLCKEFWRRKSFCSRLPELKYLLGGIDEKYIYFEGKINKTLSQAIMELIKERLDLTDRLVVL